MEQLKELKELNALLKTSLSALSTKITTELLQILDGTAMVMLPGYEKESIATFNFEYSYDWLSMVFFGSNARGLTITEDVSFLRNELKEYFSKLKEVMDEVDELEEELDDDTEEWEEMIEEYNEERSSIYEDWFTDCWQEAQNLTKNATPTYFSDDVSDLGIELISNEIVEINKNQSNIRYYRH